MPDPIPHGWVHRTVISIRTTALGSKPCQSSHMQIMHLVCHGTRTNGSQYLVEVACTPHKAPPTLDYACPRPLFLLPVIPFRPSPIFLANAERTFA